MMDEPKTLGERFWRVAVGLTVSEGPVTRLEEVRELRDYADACERLARAADWDADLDATCHESIVEFVAALSAYREAVRGGGVER